MRKQQMGEQSIDIAIVGAGIIGVCIAEKLQLEGYQVTLIDSSAPGSKCSQGNAGHFATDIILPLANIKTLLSVPKLLLDPLGPLTISWRYLPKLIPWLGQFAWAALPHQAAHTIEAIKNLNRPAIKDYQSLLARTNLQHMMVQQGALTIFQSQAARQSNQKHLELVREHGVNVELLTQHQVQELEPNLKPNMIGGLYYPDTAHCIDPHSLVQNLANHVFANGGQFIQDRVNAIQPLADGSVNIECEGKTISARQIIVAAGAWSKSLVEPLGYHLPLETERGYHLMLPNASKHLTRPVTSFERSFVMTPMQQGLRLAGTVELAGLEAEPNYQRAAILKRHAQEIIEPFNDDSATHWMGHRPSFPDSLPVIDRCQYHQNILYAFGHQHLGLTQAATTANMIAELIHSPRIKNSAYSVSRF
jgi:D-hydroxyproline dehydrogenase